MPLIVKCPKCKTKLSWDSNLYRPFCSEQCQLIDLGAWADERYRIPGRILEDESEPEDDDSDKNPN